LGILTLLFGAAGAGGCHHYLPPSSASLPGQPALARNNPLFVPVADPELVWNQVVDALDDHFKIMREERVRLVGDVLLEGRLETYPADGSTLLEPWRKDSTHGYEKLHATLQSVRRRATARVIPVAGGHFIELIVNKELEDVNHPEQATVDRSGFRYDATLGQNTAPTAAGTVTMGWISLGRDFSLEQQILANLEARLTP
jgi:hypothetical protein